MRLEAVILAAGKSERLRPLTLTKPKPMLRVSGKTLLEWTLTQLEGMVKRVWIVVGYLKERVEIEGKYGFQIRIVEQKRQLGTAHALLQLDGLISGSFLVLPGDDHFSREDLQKLKGSGVLVQETERPRDFGIVEIQDGRLKRIQEKPEKPKSNLANTGCYLLDEEIFGIIRKLKKSPRGEYELPSAINRLAERQDLRVVKAKEWIPVTYPWDLLKLNQVLLEKMEKRIYGKVEKNAVIQGKVWLGKNSIIRAGSYIQGPVFIGDNCIIGPNSFLRPYTCLENGCRVGNAVEIKNSLIGRNSFISHLSYVGDSVLGDRVNFGAGSITANLRHDEKNIRVRIKGKLIDTGLRKFGAVVADKAKLGIGTLIYPGRRIWPGVWTKPGEIVRKDLKQTRKK